MDQPLGKTDQRAARRRNRLGLAGWRTFAVILAGLVAGCLFAFGPLPFDRARWDAVLAARNDNDTTRNRMADWLLLWRSLTGKSRAEVITLLGEADMHSEANDLVYSLGRERSFISLDNETLTVTFDASGRAVSAQIVVH